MSNSTEKICEDLVEVVAIRSSGERIVIEHLYTSFTSRITILRIGQYNVRFTFRPTSRGSAYPFEKHKLNADDTAILNVSGSVMLKMQQFVAYIFRVGRVEAPPESGS